MKDFDPRNAKWGESFPREYLSYLQTAKQDFSSKYNGNQHQDMLAKDPRMVILWAGYAFSKEYNAPKGHFNAIDDIRKILRTGSPMDSTEGPMARTCWTCKGPDVLRLMQQEGIANFYAGKWASFGHQVVNPIGCADCHDTKTMDLKITRPALIEAFSRQGKDIGKATHQEKRSLVCAQCHVEYYFSGSGNYLTFPWDKGMTVETMEAYYDQLKFSDWTHSLSRTPMLKAQHPDYELFQQGIHAKRGVSCADCHMPYISEGGVKYTDHHVQSPLNNINRSCQVCHRETEEELKKNVYSMQDKIHEMRIEAEENLVKAHLEAKAAWDLGAQPSEMEAILQLIRQGQWRWDFASASHGAAFHAPLETGRILGNASAKAQEARRLLAKVLAIHGQKGEISYPDISTKEKAQQFIGLKMDILGKEKKEFLDKVVPLWDQKAQERQQCYDQEDRTILECSDTDATSWKL